MVILLESFWAVVSIQHRFNAIPNDPIRDLIIWSTRHVIGRFHTSVIKLGITSCQWIFETLTFLLQRNIHTFNMFFAIDTQILIRYSLAP